jgi:hypothetical protein
MMRVASRACGLLILSAILGCGGASAQAERLTLDNIRLINEESAAFEEIGTIPDAAKTRELQARIDKIRAELTANNKILQTLPLAQLKEIGERHKAELDQAQERLRNAFKPYRAKMPNLKKNLTPG